VIVVLVLALRRPAAPEKVPPKPPATVKAKPKTPPPPKSTPGAPALPDAAPLVLPLETSLAWRFRAGAESRHRNQDGKLDTGKLQKGQTVQFWRNLASPSRLAGLQLYEGKAERSPAGQFADIKGPGTSHPYLFFSANSGMEMKIKSTTTAPAPGASDVSPAGVTIAAVFRANASSKEPVMRPLLLSSGNGMHSFSLHFSHRVGQFWALAEKDGQVAQSLVTPEEFAKRKDGAGGNWVAAVASWDAQQGKVSLRVRSPDGKTATGPESPIPAGMSVLERINLGFCNVPKDSKLNPKEKFEGDIIEVAVYRLALDTVTQERILGALWDRYFKKKA
jgi:hypothetical protein